MNHLQTIREAVIKAVPDCMAPSEVQKGTVLKHWEGWETVACGPVDEHNGVPHENGYGPIKKFNIMGRKIGLCDVLLALELNSVLSGYQIMVDVCGDFYSLPDGKNPEQKERWNLHKDSLSSQSPETLAFLASLLSDK